VKLHGDFRYQSLKNLEADLRNQDAELASCLVNACNRFGVVVSGYSGRDESVMDELNRALGGNNPFPHGLFWTVMKGRKPLKAVANLISAAKARNVRAEIVEIETFDSLLSRIWNQLPNRPAPLIAAVSKTIARTVSLPVPAAGDQSPILRMNALPVVGLPTKALALKFSTSKEWVDLREAEGRVRGRILCTREADVYAWGHEAHLREAFGVDLKSITEADIADRVADFGSNLYLKRFFGGGYRPCSQAR
jgi:hypothetical protein